MQLVGAVAGHQGHPAAPQGADQEGQQVAGGAVGPVQVLDHQQQRASSDRRTSSDSTRRTAAPARSRPPGAPAPADRLGQEPAQAGHSRGQQGGHLGLARSGAEVAEGVHEGHVREANVADLHAAADQHPDAAALGPGGELVEQPGLADAGVAGDQPDGRAAALGPAEQGDQVAELLGPADEAAGGCGGHAGKWPRRRQRGTRSLPLEDLAALDHGAAASLRIRPPFMTGTSASSSRSSRVAGDGDDVGVAAGRQGADPVLPPEQLGGDHRGRAGAAIGVIPWRTM